MIYDATFEASKNPPSAEELQTRIRRAMSLLFGDPGAARVDVTARESDLDMEELVASMSAYAELEYDHEITLVDRYPDGSVELEVVGAYRVVMAPAGRFMGREMVLLREATPLVMNAVPALIVEAMVNVI